jgi:hypothetical protein
MVRAHKKSHAYAVVAHTGTLIGRNNFMLQIPWQLEIEAI